MIINPHRIWNFKFNYLLLPIVNVYYFFRSNLTEGPGIFEPEGYTGNNKNVKVRVLWSI